MFEAVLMESHGEEQPLGRRKLAFSDSVVHSTGVKPKELVEMKDSDQEPRKKDKHVKKPYDQMVLEAIAENDPRRKGLSFPMIQKFIKGKHMIEGDIRFYVKRAYQKLNEKKMIEHVTGNGFSGSVRLSKDHVKNMQKEEKLALKAQKAKMKTALTKQDKKSDKNNNKKDAKAKTKSKDATKVNPKKTAITKTKIDRSGGKVRLSIASVPVPATKASKAKASIKLPKPKKTGAKAERVAPTKNEKAKKSTKPKAKIQSTKTPSV